MLRFRQFFERCILLLVTAAVAENYFVLGMLRPLRVDSGSMAETVKGPHYRVKCNNCGYEFACDATLPPTSGFATCPLCGNSQNKLDDKIYPGERLFVDRTAFWWRTPRRWEPIVFRERESGQLTIKRIVGLPGESVAIRDGEIFINGERATKPTAVRDAMRILVYDSQYKMPLPLPLGESRGEGPATTHVSDTQDKSNEPSIRSVLTPPDRILDNLGYNQTESRRLNEVHQVWQTEHNDRTQILRDVYYTDVPLAGTGLPPDRYDLGDDAYFVLGDNSPLSLDSRHWQHPGLPYSAIIGKPLGIK